MSADRASVTVRRFEEPDLEPVVELAELVDQAPGWSRSVYASLFEADPVLERVALIAGSATDGQVLGFAIASLILPEAELENIAVAPDARRRGVGRRLFEAVVDQIRSRGARELRLEVRASNHNAIRFYQSLGFESTGRRPAYYTETKEDAILMSLSLDEAGPRDNGPSTAAA
jgi:[ribosomal protein S18]-alanine N-acetyltransferase